MSGALQYLPPREPIVLRNENCPYCGAQLGDCEWDAEHAIARRFVPRGKFADSWNLITRACIVCNRRKADLEDDLSAITMQPDPTGEFARPDPALHAEARRKAAGSASRRTGRPVARSAETMTIDGSPMPGVRATATLVGPPQPDLCRVFELARLHASAFFYYVTYNPDTRRGGFFLGDFLGVSYCLRSDWGSALHRTFMRGVVTWEPRCIAVAADGYFKIAIRRHPTITCWSWAVEWNHNMRVIGFAGERGPIEPLFEGMQIEEPVATTRGADGSITRFRLEVPLSPDDDILFDE